MYILFHAKLNSFKLLRDNSENCNIAWELKLAEIVKKIIIRHLPEGLLNVFAGI